MSLRFFRRIPLIPGFLSLNFSGSGVSLSIGPRGFKVTIGPRRARTTVSAGGVSVYQDVPFRRNRRLPRGRAS